MRRELRSGANSTYSLRYSVLFATADCHEVLTEDRIDFVAEVLDGFADNYGVDVVRVDGGPDHVRLDIEAKPTTDLVKFVTAAKGATARRLRNEYGAELVAEVPDGSLWDDSYCLVSTGQVSVDTLSEYLDGRRA